jgi:acetyltransferase-like isoleucine patch superfamily enzyme
VIGAARVIADDWFPGTVPEAVVVGSDVYLDSSSAFQLCRPAGGHTVRIGVGSGVYAGASLIVAAGADVEIGPCCCLNGSTIVASQRVSIGAHALLSWGVVITDLPASSRPSVADRRAALLRSAADAGRMPPDCGRASPVTIGDGVWVGFDAVVGGGVHIGDGSIVGCRSVVLSDVPPRTVVAGNPAVVIRRLDP